MLLAAMNAKTSSGKWRRGAMWGETSSGKARRGPIMMRASTSISKLKHG